MAWKRTDENQPQVVNDLRKVCGYSVQQIHIVGKGCPDIVVGAYGINFLFELKSHEKSKLTEDEIVWHNAWIGQVHVVHSVLEILRVIYAKLCQMTYVVDEQHFEHIVGLIQSFSCENNVHVEE